MHERERAEELNHQAVNFSGGNEMRPFAQKQLMQVPASAIWSDEAELRAFVEK
jgi:hypothetical protein